MKYITVKIEKDCRDRLNVFRDKLGVSSQTEVLNMIFDFIEKYNVDLDKEFSNSALEQLVSSLNETLHIVELLNTKSDKILQQEDKNTTRVVKILQAQERDILKPILMRRIEETVTKTTEEIISSEPFLSDIKQQNIVPVVDVKKEEKQTNELYVLERKIESLQDDLNRVNKQLEISKNRYSSLFSCFNKAVMTNRYNASLTEEEYRKFQ
ncbi:hypothetical protein HX049_17075 [Myroides odoratimimus]|uniref:hypothetical protein n=1 Tax=Myroides odoratimimus TaxID=76832 RepID=UPI002576271D|nr:hypothetical protein [Myroides odoratimimus]MDM1398857.1 hypothetical protein [Myroides odoratimimus]